MWLATVLRSGALGNTKRSSIHVVDVIRMMVGSTQQGVENKMLFKYGGAADKSNEYNENEYFSDQGMTKQKDRADKNRDTRAYRDSATDSK